MPIIRINQKMNLLNEMIPYYTHKKGKNNKKRKMKRYKYNHKNVLINNINNNTLINYHYPDYLI